MPHAWHATEYVNFAVEFNNHLNDLQPYQPSQTEAVATSYSLFDLTLLTQMDKTWFTLYGE